MTFKIKQTNIVIKTNGYFSRFFFKFKILDTKIGFYEHLLDFTEKKTIYLSDNSLFII